MEQEPCCIAPPAAWDREHVQLDREEVHYLTRVLRLRAGAAVRVMDGCGREGRGQLHEIRPSSAAVRLHCIRRHPCATPRRVLIQALIRGPRMEWLLQKATELGASEIIVYQAQRSVARWPAGEREKRLTRWRRVVREAARQCGVPWIPVMAAPHDRLPVPDRALPQLMLWGSLHPSARPLFTVLEGRDRSSTTAAGIVIGPEGDLTSAEQTALEEAGALPVNLGPRTLRAETAALYALSAMDCFWNTGPRPGEHDPGRATP